MNSQRKIFTCFLLFTSMTGVSFVKADFTQDRIALGVCFKAYLSLIKSWSMYKWEGAIDPLPAYSNAYQGWQASDLAGFEKTTKEFFVNIEPSVDFTSNPSTKTNAIITLCNDIKSTCADTYHPPNVPLRSYLKSLYEKSNSDTSAFDASC